MCVYGVQVKITHIPLSATRTMDGQMDAALRFYADCHRSVVLCDGAAGAAVGQ